MAAGRSWADDFQMEQILYFEKLQSLTIEGPGISDALVPRIAECENLASLAMRNTLIGDVGIAQLTGLAKLRIIDMRVAPLVTDAAMVTLAKMPELRAVRLVGGNVTGASVEPLSKLAALKQLTLNQTGISEEGIQQLREAWPDCSIRAN